MISLLTDRFSPRCCRRPLAFVTKEQPRKKERWETIDFWWFFSSSLTIFSIKLLSPSPTLNVEYLRPQTEFHHAAHATPSRHHILIGAAKRMVSFSQESIFYSDVYSPFFQLICCCRPQLATWDIYDHRQDITTPLTTLPLVTIYKSVMQYERWVFVQNQFFTLISTHHFFN